MKKIVAIVLVLALLMTVAVSSADALKKSSLVSTKGYVFTYAIPRW